VITCKGYFTLKGPKFAVRLSEGTTLKNKYPVCNFVNYLALQMDRICKDVLAAVVESKDTEELVRRNNLFNSGHFFMTISTLAGVTKGRVKCNMRSFSSWPLATMSKKSSGLEFSPPQIDSELRFLSRPIAFILSGPNSDFQFKLALTFKHWRLSARLST